VPEVFLEFGVFEFSSAFVLARSSLSCLQCVWTFYCFLRIEGVGRIACVCVPCLLVFDGACVSFWLVMWFGWLVEPSVQEVEGGV
jgi:hypothetical protein